MSSTTLFSVLDKKDTIDKIFNPSIFNTEKKFIIQDEDIICFFGTEIGEAFIVKINELNLYIEYVISPLHISSYQTSIELSCYLKDKTSKEEVGRFSIFVLSKPENPKIIYASLTTYIEEDARYRRQNLSRLLMGINLQIFFNIYKDEDKHLVIDGDASSGFWDKIGMIETGRFYYQPEDDRKGYEKYILLKNAYKWAFGPDAECDEKWCSITPFQDQEIKITTKKRGKKKDKSKKGGSKKNKKKKTKRKNKKKN